MNARHSLLSAAFLSVAFCAPAGATTTTYLFCSNKVDGATTAQNIAANETLGWTMSALGSNTSALQEGNYSVPSKFNNTSKISSPTYASGFFVSKVVVGARVSTTALARKVTIVPTYENGTTGSAVELTLGSAGVLEDVVFPFSSKDKIVSFSVSIPGTDGTAYVYYVNVDTFKLLSSPSHLALDGDAGESGFTVGWDAVMDAQGYSVKLVGPNSSVVWSNDVDSATTTKTFTGLSSSTQYSVSVVALGDYDTTDDSVPATLQVTTDTSSVAAPTLVVSNTSSWTAGTAGTSAVSATLEGNVACAVESVSMSDGSTATVENGTLSWTPPFSATASTVTATFTVTHDGLSWYLDEDLSVAATPAPSAPVISFTGATPKAFTASWSASEGGPVSSYKVRVWTGRATPDDSTGGASENFAGYMADGTVPSGWTFMNSGNPYDTAPNPVDFRSGESPWVSSPDFGGNVTTLSFRIRSYTAKGTFSVSAAKTGSEEWTEIASYSSDDSTLTTGEKSVSLSAADGYSRFKFQFLRTSGGLSFGSFSVSGTDWPAADFLEGWGGAKVSVGSATSQTFSNPVPGELNYVEVTAVGPAGSTTSFIASVAVPGRPCVIAVK